MKRKLEANLDVDDDDSLRDGHDEDKGCAASEFIARWRFANTHYKLRSIYHVCAFFAIANTAGGIVGKVLFPPPS